MPGKFVAAFAGSADITAENAASLLDDKLPDELGRLYIPTAVPRRFAGLKRVVSWLEKELEQPDGSKPYIPTDDLVAVLLTRREAGDDVHLVLLYNPENDDDYQIGKAAIDAGIPVHNLAAAYDDLLLEETQPEDEPAPAEPTAEEIDISAKVDRDIQDDIAAAAPGAVQVTINFTPEQLAAVVGIAKTILEAFVRPGTTVNNSFTRSPDVIPHREDAHVGPTGALKVREEDRGAPPAAKSANDGERPKGSKPYYTNEDGEYRPARGPAKDGETKVYLTPEEIEKIGK